MDRLNSEERLVFENWQKILTKEEANIEDIRGFIQSQIDVIEARWRDFEVSNEKKAESIPYYTTYKNILLAINGPKAAKEALETQLTQLLNQ